MAKKPTKSRRKPRRVPEEPEAEVFLRDTPYAGKVFKKGAPMPFHPKLRDAVVWRQQGVIGPASKLRPTPAKPASDG